MRRSVFAIVLSLLVLGCAGGVRPSGAPLPGVGEILVTFYVPDASPTLRAGSQRYYRDGSRWQADLITRQRIRSFARTHDLTLGDGWPVAALGVYCVSFGVTEHTSLAELQRSAAQSRHIHRVQANQSFRGMAEAGGVRSYNDPLFSLQFGEYAQKLIDLHALSRGAGVRVGIVDSEVDSEHPDLVGQIYGQEAFAGSAGLEELAHGTAMAGIIAAADDNRQGVVGVAPDAEVHVFGACRSRHQLTQCDSFSIAKALQAAMDLDMQIVNLSLAGPFDPLLSDLIQAAQRRGVIVVAAQNLDDLDNNFPASEPGVFSASGGLGYWFTYPEQLTTLAGGGYQVFRGSSVSAAGFTGVAAVLRSRHDLGDTRQSLQQLQAGCTHDAKNVFDSEMCL